MTSGKSFTVTVNVDAFAVMLDVVITMLSDLASVLDMARGCISSPSSHPAARVVTSVVDADPRASLILNCRITERSLSRGEARAHDDPMAARVARADPLTSPLAT